MCYAIPAKLIAIDGHTATVDYFGEERQILLDLDDVRIGDYLYAQGGISVRKIPTEEAKAVLATWQDVFFELQKTDAALAKLDESQLSANALAVLQKINLRKSLKPIEMRTLLELQDPNELSVLYEIANNVRQREHGNASCVHGILEFSNYCSQNCHYCGIRHEHSLKRYRMSVTEIVTAAKQAVDQFGFKALVLQSGEDPWYDAEKLEKIVKAVRQLGVLVFLSIGLRDKATYQKLYDAGARAALLRFETSNPDIFAKLRPGTTLEARIELIKSLKEMGYIIATGFMLGLPGETTDDITNNILLTKTLAPDMYSFGPFIPTEGTPLADNDKATKTQVLKAIAVTRFTDINSNILVTTALETLDANAKREALLAGANSLMLNVTPAKYRDLYTIYDGKQGISLATDDCIKDTVTLLYDLGRAPTDIGIVENNQFLKEKKL